MPPPSSSPKYIYKILPGGPSNPPPPCPLPSALPISVLDERDGFIHASTSRQLLGTLRKFFGGEEGVWILRMRYERLREEGVVKWESPAGEVGQEGEEGFFPHLYNGLKVGKDEVEAVGEWKKGAGQWSREGWPFREEDVPQ